MGVIYDEKKYDSQCILEIIMHWLYVLLCFVYSDTKTSMRTALISETLVNILLIVKTQNKYKKI